MDGITGNPAAGRGYGAALRLSGGILRRRFGVLFALFVVCDLPLRAVGLHYGLGEGDMRTTLGFDFLSQVLLFVAQLGAAQLVAREVDGGPAMGLFAAARAGFSRWGALVTAWIVFANQLSVGLVLGLLPGLVWLVQGRFFVQAVALREERHPFHHSRAVVRGDAWRLVPVTAVVLGLPMAVDALAALAFPALAFPAQGGSWLPLLVSPVSSAVLAGLAVFDTALFLEMERRKGLGPPEPARAEATA
ncbi:MAG: hypothetical protein Q8P41_09740 [Pseudomonadota bacterium]|nr:hypothetical protein [Pseudomonadota bacterium]